MARKYRMMLIATLCGGTLLQATSTTTCQDTLVSSLTDLAISVGMQILLSGLSGVAT